MKWTSPAATRLDQALLCKGRVIEADIWAYCLMPIHMHLIAVLDSQDELSDEDAALLRGHERMGLPLGSAGFVEYLEKLLNRVLKPQKRGCTRQTLHLNRVQGALHYERGIRYRKLVYFETQKMRGSSMNRQKGKNTKITRRHFIKVTGTVVLVAGTGWNLSAADEIPPSDGYLLVDREKCQGCASCMLACSLVHEGVESLSLARIQIIQNSFESFPDDLTIEQCRQCVEPPCVKECPTGALKANAMYGNVRMVDKEKCIGCGTCFDVCPYTPSRAVLAADKDYGGEVKSQKCDLCANTPFHWDEAGGGPDGKQACVAVCPVGAIKFTKKIPKQKGDGGYKVDLRGRNWGKLGYPIN